MHFFLENAAVFIPLILLPFGLLVREGLSNNRFYTSDAIFFWIIFLYACASFTYMYLSKKFGKQWIHILFAALFHVLVILYVMLVSGFLSAILAVWIVLIISTDMRFGNKGFIASFLCLLLAAGLTLTFAPLLSLTERIEIAQASLIVGGLGYAISRIRSTTDKERQVLAKTRRQEIYQRERLLALVNSMGDAVVATDEQGTIKVYNATMLSLLDTNKNLTGKSIDVALQLHTPQGKRFSLVNEAREKHMVFSRTDLAHRFPDGEIMKLYVNVAPIQPGYQSHTESGYIFILRDITKEKSLEEERDEFISVVSHELRTPLAIAEGNLSNLKVLSERDVDQAIMRQALDGAYDQIVYLAKLVNDLGTLSRAERGVGAEAENIDVGELLHDMYTTYLPQAQSKGLHLDLDIPPKLPHIKTSRLYLQEILQNFITNAIKYTKEGSVTIRALLKHDRLFFAITDSGIGISKADQKHIFEKFYRSEDYRTRESSGTGLGLYVCKKLAEKLGIEITFTSRLNHGSTFSLAIPKNSIASEEKKPSHQ